MYLCTRKSFGVMSFLTRIYPFKQSEHWQRDSIIYGVAIWALKLNPDNQLAKQLQQKFFEGMQQQTGK